MLHFCLLKMLTYQWHAYVFAFAKSELTQSLTSSFRHDVLFLLQLNLNLPTLTQDSSNSSVVGTVT
jgi:hypothetical protein